tara:strand:- start:50246 stop:50980 length:735 start_codon:yes stop_codon:yes gene_type:complete
MPINILINGASGRMGQQAIAAIEQDETLNLVATAGRHDDLGLMIASSQAQVVVDLTVASVGFTNANKIIAAGAHPVIGTSGFTQTQVKMLQQQCAEKKLGGIIAPNFSIGGVLMMQFSKMAAKYFNHVEIVERHHENKQDAPSGTAMRTAEMIAEAQPNIADVKCDEKIPGAHGGHYENVSIHSIRMPGNVAHQEVIFGAHGETLTIKHDSINRECFMPGLLLACKKVTELDQLLFGLEHLLDI